MNAFHVLGPLFALWAVTVAVVGITREGFPRPGAQTLLVGSISALLAASAIGSAVITSALEDEDEGGKVERPSATQGAGETLRLSADPGGAFRFDKTSLKARPGRVSLLMKNPSSLRHNISIEGDGIQEQGKTVDKGGTSSVQAQLKPGVYTFYCAVAGHRQGGMEGRLTVR